jgi:hypothetical protein
MLRGAFRLSFPLSGSVFKISRPRVSAFSQRLSFLKWVPLSPTQFLDFHDPSLRSVPAKHTGGGPLNCLHADVVAASLHAHERQPVVCSSRKDLTTSVTWLSCKVIIGVFPPPFGRFFYFAPLHSAHLGQIEQTNDL